MTSKVPQNFGTAVGTQSPSICAVENTVFILILLLPGQRVLQDYKRVFLGVQNDQRASDSNEEEERKHEGEKQNERKTYHGNRGNGKRYLRLVISNCSPTLLQNARELIKF